LVDTKVILAMKDRALVKDTYVSVRCPSSVKERLEKCAERAGVNVSVWALEALLVQIEVDEVASVHVPQAIKDAIPKKRGARIIMPKGRTMAGDFFDTPGRNRR
jgi:hypothetical protein